MTVAVVDNGDGTHTITWSVTATSANLLALADDAGEYVYPIRWRLYTGDDPPEPRPWSDLSGAEKLTVLDNEIKFMLKAYAESFYVNEARDAAAETARAEADALYDV